MFCALFNYHKTFVKRRTTISFNFGPMTSTNNMNNNRSILNVSGQFIRLNPKTDGMITESYFRLNIGVTFNEFWFFKSKVN